MTLSADASDNVAVVGVQFRVNGANVGAEDTTAPYTVNWDSTAVANGAHQMTAVARDAAGNSTTSTAVNVTVDNAVPDTQAPVVSVTAPAEGATVSGAVTLSATASDNVGVVGVQFRVNGANVGAEDTMAPYTVNWDSTAVANGAYQITAVARDAAGNSSTSTVVNVTVDNAVPDTQAPVVSVTAPAEGATVSGAVTLSATASDNVGVVGVQFRVNGANVGVEDTVAPYTVNWDSTAVANGAYQITAVARDAAGNSSTSTVVNVTVDNAVPDTQAPVVSVTAPAEGATVSGAVTLSATASDNVGVVGVQFRVNGANVGVEDTVAPYTVNWDSTAVANGAYQITAVARDAAGNSTTSTVVNVTVDNTVPDTQAPVVSVTAPAEGATVSGAVTLSATASDNVGVVGVQFRVNGANVGVEDTVAPYTVNWDSTAVANGAYQITAVARDAAGNSSTSTVVNVTVNNIVDTEAPVVSVTAPAEGATVSGAVTLNASASDNVGVVGVQFRVNGANVGAEDTVAPYTVNWDSTAVANGAYQITAVARDGSRQQQHVDGGQCDGRQRDDGGLYTSAGRCGGQRQLRRG